MARDKIVPTDLNNKSSYALVIEKTESHASGMV